MIDSPVKFVTQVRYQAKDAEILVIINSNMNERYQITITPSPAMTSQKQPWLWNAETGQRYKMATDGKKILLDMEPADLKLIVFDKQKKGPVFPVYKASKETILTTPWSVTGEHVDGHVITTEMHELKDLKELSDWVNFCGTIIYRNNFMLNDNTKIERLDLGKVFGVSELVINGQNLGAKWYGRREYPVGNLLKAGSNEIKIKIVTTMGNYLKSLTDNPVAQYWTNEGRTIQPLQSMGLIGPVGLY
jgi:hypothetical protein